MDGNENKAANRIEWLSMREISAQEAHDLLQKDSSVAYLDVRSTQEFRAGHPRGALHVPLMERDPASGRMSPNPLFLSQVGARIPKDRPVICGCQSGGRSARAVLMLNEAGFRDVTNMRGGFGGAKDPMSGQVLEAGWSQLGLPVEAG